MVQKAEKNKTNLGTRLPLRFRIRTFAQSMGSPLTIAAHMQLPRSSGPFGSAVLPALSTGCDCMEVDTALPFSLSDRTRAPGHDGLEHRSRLSPGRGYVSAVVSVITRILA
jgi:hypothetical protein